MKKVGVTFFCLLVSLVSPALGQTPDPVPTPDSEPGPEPEAAEADPDLPRESKLSWTAADESWTQSAILDFTAIGVLGASREAGYPELGRIRGGEPEALRLHVGAFGDFGRWAYLARFDIAETLRINRDDVSERPLAALSRLVDGAFGLIRLGGGVRLMVGRQPVAVSRFHDVSTSVLAAGAPPFVIDRVFPSRRWGARAKLRHGRFDVALGGWLDGDSVEPRIIVGDPSIGREAGVSANGSVVVVGADERAPHWLRDEMAVTLRSAVLMRFGEGTRTDALLGAEASWSRLGVVIEAIASLEDEQLHISVASEATGLWHRRSAVFLRAELDGERDIYATGAGISYFATSDRRSRLALFAWRRRDTAGISERDGVILELQSEL